MFAAVHDASPVPTDDPVREGKGLARQRQRGRVEKATEPLVMKVVLVDCLIYRGITLPGDTPHHHQTVTNPLRSR